MKSIISGNSTIQWLLLIKNIVRSILTFDLKPPLSKGRQSTIKSQSGPTFLENGSTLPLKNYLKRLRAVIRGNYCKGGNFVMNDNNHSKILYGHLLVHNYFDCSFFTVFLTLWIDSETFTLISFFVFSSVHVELSFFLRNLPPVL